MDIKVLFVDLHGVIVNTPKIFDLYEKLTKEHLIELFGLGENEAEKRYDNAHKTWKESAYNYLKNPNTSKTGKKFLEFLKRCDQEYTDKLYKDLDIKGVNEDKLRTKPFEYNISIKIQALYPEVRETLEGLQDAGYILHMASSSHTSHIKGILRANMIEHYFETIIGFDTVASTKHTFAFYKQMLRQTGAKADESVMLGNSIHEIIKPRKLGMYTVHINRERQVPSEIKKMANLSFKDLKPLGDKLEQIKPNPMKM
jgi:FMN phosphatase YigB (HAD superfamily)